MAATGLVGVAIVALAFYGINMYYNVVTMLEFGMVFLFELILVLV
jgi:hypothetical protein